MFTTFRFYRNGTTTIQNSQKKLPSHTRDTCRLSSFLISPLTVAVNLYAATKSLYMILTPTLLASKESIRLIVWFFTLPSFSRNENSST